MFSIQKCTVSHKIYIDYNEYLSSEEDESAVILENFLKDGAKDFEGVIDLITVKNLSCDDIWKMKELCNILRKNNITNLSVISDNEKLAKKLKTLIPDASVKIFRIGKEYS